MTCAAIFLSVLLKLTSVYVLVAVDTPVGRTFVSACIGDDPTERTENFHVARMAIRVRMSSFQGIAGAAQVIEGTDLE